MAKKPGKDTSGLGKQRGFPIRMLKRFKERALVARQPYVVVAKSGYYSSGLKRRVIKEKLELNGREQ